MSERNSPKIETFTVSGAEQRVYVSPLAPLEIPVSFFNSGESVINIRFAGNTDLIPLSPGFGITANPDPDVFASTDSGASVLIVATGVSSFSSGVSSTGGLSMSELSAIAAAGTQKTLLTEILLEQRLTNEHLRLITDQMLTPSDFPEWRN